MKRRMRSQMLLALVCSLAIVAGCASAPRQTTAPAQTQQPAPQAAPKMELGALVPELLFYGPSEGYDSRQFEANRMIVQTWEKELGVKSKLELVPDFPALSRALAVGSREKIHVFSFGYVSRPSRVDPDELLSRPFMCEADANYGAYCNSEYDGLVKASKSEYDVSKRRDLVFKAQEILARDLPVLVYYHPDEPVVYNKARFGDVTLAVGAGTYTTWTVLNATPLTSDKTYRYAIANAVRSIHPMLHADFSQDVMFSGLVYDTLTKMGPKGDVVPWLANSWTTSDPTTIRFNLRQGHKFHDGKPVTAQDVKFSYDYLKQWKIGVYLNNLNPIQSVTVIDPNTVEFKLASPNATALALTMGQVPIIPKHIWEGVVEKNNLAHPKDWKQASNIGSGPFKFVSHQPGVGVRMERFTDHWYPVKVDAFELREFPDSRSGFNALLNQRVDFITQDEVGPSEMEEAKKTPHLAVVTHQSITSRFIGFNMRADSPFRDYNFRLALSQAVDFNTITQVFNQGLAKPGKTFIAPGNQFWHNPNVQIPSFDIKKAKETLTKAGYGWDEQGRLHYPKNYNPQVLGK